MSSYLVIARKWRPALFDDIVGQEHVTRTLRNAVDSGRIAHAYLFSGPRGVGKTTAARILAKSLNCEEGPTSTPCNTCTSCSAITSASSVDVFEIDGASNTSVDNVRELRESVRYVPTRGKYKVYIIDEVHMLSTSAFNALLKTLEEPPPHAVFIFATTEVHKIPLTILSRCQRFDFKRIPLKEIHGRLREIMDKEGLKYEEGALYTIAREADGSLRDAQSLLDQVVAYSGTEVTEADVADSLGLMDRTVLIELISAIIRGDSKECLNIVEKIYDFGYDLKRACSDLLEYIRDLTVLKVSGAEALAELADGELARLDGISGEVGAERLHVLFNVISNAYGEVSRSVFPRYAFEMTVLKAAHVSDLRPVGELISALESVGQEANGQGVALRRKGRVDGAALQERHSCSDGPVSSEERRTPSDGYAHGVISEPKASEAAAEYVAASSNTGRDTETASAGPSASGDPSSDASAFVEAVSRGNAIFAGGFQAVEVSVEEGALIIAGSPGACKVFESEPKKRFIEERAREFFGRVMRVEFRHTGAGPGARKRKKPDTDHLITEAVRLFDGKVIEDRRRQNVQ